MDARNLLFSLAVLFSLSVSAVSAETIYFKSGELLDGTIIGLKSDAFNVRTQEGTERNIPRKEIARIEFAPLPTNLATTVKPKSLSEDKPFPTKDETFLTSLQKGDAKYETPIHTFHIWRQAAIGGKIQDMVSCYASFKQREIKKKLKKYSRKQIDLMRESTAQTTFIPGQPFYQGDRAVLEVNWQKGLAGDSQMLQFILENNDWKIIH